MIRFQGRKSEENKSFLKDRTLEESKEADIEEEELAEAPKEKCNRPPLESY